jgi:hypothetical protein
VAEDGTIFVGKYGSHPASLRREARVADGIDTPMDGVQAPDPHAMPHPVLVQTCLAKLPYRDDTVLPICDRGNANVGTGGLVAHIATKAPGNADAPPRRG